MKNNFNMHNVENDKIKVVFYFTRHGHSYSNYLIESSNGIIPWNLLMIGKMANNSMLTDLGIGRSINVGKQIKSMLPEKYVLMCSPLKRAILTAHFQYNIYCNNNRPIYIVPYINEISNIGAYKIIKKTGIDTNSHNEYDLNDIWYKTNPYQIPFIYGFGDKYKFKEEINNNLFNPDPESFFNYFVNNFYEYMYEAKDENNNYNFVIVSHDIYMKKLFEYLNINENVLEKIENNSVFMIEMEFSMKHFFRKVSRDELIDCVTYFKDLTKFKKKVYNIDNLIDKDIFLSCHYDNGKSINKYVKNTYEYNKIIKILFENIKKMEINANFMDKIKIRNEYLNFLKGL